MRRVCDTVRISACAPRDEGLTHGPVTHPTVVFACVQRSVRMNEAVMGSGVRPEHIATTEHPGTSPDSGEFESTSGHRRKPDLALERV